MWFQLGKKILKIARVMVRAVLKKRVLRKTRFEKNAFKVLSNCVHSAGSRIRPTRLRKNAKLNRIFFFSCMKPFASYSRRFKLNFKPKKTDFLKNLHWCCPLRKTKRNEKICKKNPLSNQVKYFFSMLRQFVDFYDYM